MIFFSMLFLSFGSSAFTVKSHTSVPLCISGCGQSNQGALLSSVYSSWLNQNFCGCVDDSNEVKIADTTTLNNTHGNHSYRRSRWPRGLRRRSAAARFAGIVGSNTTGCMHICLL